MPTYSDAFAPVATPPHEQLLPQHATPSASSAAAAGTRAAPKPRPHELRPLYLGRGDSSRPSNLRHSQQYSDESQHLESEYSPNTQMSRNRRSAAGSSSASANGKDRAKATSMDSEHRETLLSARERGSFQIEEPDSPTDNHGHPEGKEGASFMELPRQEQKNFMMLVLLYFLQGVPMGLAMGSIPFLLKHELSYGQIGVFSLASYPYSLKLLWSPIVDAIWSRRMGRRKSWIVPIQTISGIMLVWLGSQADYLMKNAATMLYFFTFVFFMLVMLCATQDIAVDGWALTLLRPENLSYASTAQTVGLTAGQFLSFTVFLAFNSKDFSNKWFRKEPLDYGLMTISGYLKFWGWAYLIVTIGLALLKREERTKEKDSIASVYKTMWGVIKLKHVQTFIIIHLICKIGFQANDGVTNLKLLDLGFSQEDLALTVLIDFPFEIALGYYVGQWCSYFSPMRLWMWAFLARLLAAVLAQITVMIFPKDGVVTTWYLLTVICSHVFSTFTSTTMFVAVSAFHAKIADPAIGGTYMTLLATVSNLGGTFPRIFVLKFVDYFTKATCEVLDTTKKPFDPFSCALERERHRCKDLGGTCTIYQDGYYITNVVCVIFGLISFYLYIKPKATYLQALPLKAWREGYN